MSVTTLNAVPVQMVAGDTVSWLIGFTGYTPSSYPTGLLMFAGAPGNFSLAGTVSGLNYQFSAASSVSRLWTPGVYGWSFQAWDGAGSTGNRITTAFVGTMAVLNDPSLAPVVSHSGQMLTLIEAALVGRIPAGMERYMIDGQEIWKIPAQTLLNLRKTYKSEVKAEQIAAAIANGTRSGRSVRARFTATNPFPSAPYPFNTPR